MPSPLGEGRALSRPGYKNVPVSHLQGHMDSAYTEAAPPAIRLHFLIYEARPERPVKGRDGRG